MVILDGMMLSFGVFFLDLLDYYGESKGKTAMVGSMLMGMHLFLGPVTSALVSILRSIFDYFSQFRTCTFWNVKIHCPVT